MSSARPWLPSRPDGSRQPRSRQCPYAASSTTQRVAHRRRVSVSSAVALVGDLQSSCYWDRVCQAIPDRGGLLHVGAQLLQLLVARVRTRYPAGDPDGGEAGARARKPKERAYVDVALDVVLHPCHLDTAGGRIGDVPDGVAEAECLQQQLDRVRSLVGAEQHRWFVAA